MKSFLFTAAALLLAAPAHAGVDPNLFASTFCVDRAQGVTWDEAISQATRRANDFTGTQAGIPEAARLVIQACPQYARKDEHSRGRRSAWNY